MLPPGPQAGRLAQSAAFHRDPLRFLQRNRDRFGDVFTIRVAVAGPMAVVADPDAAGRVIATDPASGHGGEARRRILGMVSPQSVLGADGPQHENARGRLEGAFTPDAMDGLGEPMAAIATRHAASWPQGRPFRVLPRMRALLDEVFVRLVLGIRDERRAEALARAVGRMLWTPGNPPFPPPGDGNGLAGQAAKRLFERRSEPVARLLAEEIDDRRAQDHERHDAIGCMLAARPELSTPQAVDQLIPLLMAGQEPPAAALTWLADRVAREPGATDRFLAAAPDDPDREAFVRETLRLTPAVHSVVRRLTRPLDVAGHELPAGVVAMVPVVLLHRDPSSFPGPDEFRPERFRSMGESPAYLPFGGGNRRCLGEWLARAEIAHVLPAVLRQVRLRAVWPSTERMIVRGTVLVPHRSGLAIAQRA
jgi:cytochrome P450